MQTLSSGVDARLGKAVIEIMGVHVVSGKKKDQWKSGDRPVTDVKCGCTTKAIKLDCLAIKPDATLKSNTAERHRSSGSPGEIHGSCSSPSKQVP